METARYSAPRDLEFTINLRIPSSLLQLQYLMNLHQAIHQIINKIPESSTKIELPSNSVPKLTPEPVQS
jgi:hypothetical protein